jgi:hypothetical protein
MAVDAGSRSGPNHRDSVSIRQDALLERPAVDAVIAMNPSTYYLQQAELCERQAAFVTPDAGGRSFMFAAAQWRELAARATAREPIKQIPARARTV